MDILSSKLEGADMSVRLTEKMLFKSTIYFVRAAWLHWWETSEGGLFLVLISGCSSAFCVFIPQEMAGGKSANPDTASKPVLTDRIWAED